MRPPAWMARALCAHAGIDPDLWFPDSGHREQAAVAKAICARCPVLRECAEYAEATRPRDGVWGGLSPEERGVLYRNRGRLTPQRRERRNAQARERRRQRHEEVAV